MQDKKSLFTASLLGGAIGDALGYTVEFMLLDEIIARFGRSGITDLVIAKGADQALISDDTQMTLFTADGMMWAHERCSTRGIGSYTASGMYQSYLRWYYTQTAKMPHQNDLCWLELQPHEGEDSILNYKELFSRRAPGNSCLSALASGKMGTMEQPINNSKGCGGVMRVAPVGLFLHKESKTAFSVGAEVAAITHGHPTGYLAAGAFAAIIAELINGNTLNNSIKTSIQILKSYPNHKETLTLIEYAIALSETNKEPEVAIYELGEGWIAEEALAIALYCALKETDFRKALIMAVNHDGDSDSTGAICGNILGAYYGLEVIPQKWINNIELKDLIINISGKIFDMSDKAFNII